MSEVSYLNY